MSISILIPVYNEATILAARLKYLLQDQTLTKAQIIIICNGCTDESVNVARQFTPQVEVFELAEGSKTAAINYGNEQARYFPRVYLDADIIVSGQTIIDLCTELNQQQWLAASPQIQFNYQQSDILVRHFYMTAQHSNYYQQQFLSNVIAISEQGYQRVHPLPDIIADDEFIRCQFSCTERGIVKQCTFIYECPNKISVLIKVLTRVHRGNQQLQQIFPQTIKTIHKLKTKTQLQQLYSSSSLFSFSIFILTKLAVNIRLRYQVMTQKKITWERDDTTR